MISAIKAIPGRNLTVLNFAYAIYLNCEPASRHVNGTLTRGPCSVLGLIYIFFCFCVFMLSMINNSTINSL